MSKTKDITPETKLRLNPALRKGTWDRIELYAKAYNIDSATHAVALEKIVHDHCDEKGIPNLFDNVLKN
ncbi:MAG: hypothetical protein WC121_14220 [Candidatus Kapaibacterium sp.]